MTIRSGRKCPVWIDRSLIFASVLGALVCSTGSRKYEQTFSLGGHKLGEKLSYFRATFPGAACGTAVPNAVNRKTLDDPDGSGWLTCCVDDPQQLAVFSKFQILSVGKNCRLLAYFWKERLQSLSYAVKVLSPDQILSAFEQSYGPSTYEHDIRGSRIIAWWFDSDVMQLNFQTIPGEEVTDELYDNSGLPFTVITYIDMWRNCDLRTRGCP